MGSLGVRCTREVVEARRRMVVWMTGRSWTAPEIARELNIHPRTVQRMRQSAREDRPIGRPPATWHIVNREKRNRARNERRRRARLAQTA